MGRSIDRRPTAGLVLGAPMDHGDARDVSSIGGIPSLVNSPTNNGTYWTFSAASTKQHITYPDNAALDVTTGLTACGWVNLTDTGNNYFLSKWDSPATTDSWIFYPASGGTLLFSTSTNGSYQARDTTSTGTVNNGAWRHIAATYDGSTQAVYIDGVLDTSNSHSGSLYNSTTPISVGGLGAGGGTLANYMDGSIDDPRVYNFALSATQIAIIHQKGRR